MGRKDIEGLEGFIDMTISIEENKIWPCIKAEGLDLFSTTADQRILIGEDLFIKTHFPIRMRAFNSRSNSEDISEKQLLEKIINSNIGTTGNRIFVLYGAAGSGKSELIRWLQLNISRENPARAQSMIRIPRTELDILSITENFQHLLSDNYFSEATHLKWREAKKKPRTISKLILLTALERMNDSDEFVNSLYYRLLEWVQPRISRVLGLEENPIQNDDMPIDVITQEDLEQLKAETSLSIPLDYEQFRYHLLLAFREYLLEGIHLPNVLSLISNDFYKEGKRPILLIDDLVQSINLFATDILDYLLTLESGNWDVIIGLTPDALSQSKRGKELLDRITYLDTIDDRVEKLWLSDMYGHDSYFLTLENCSDFIFPYLEAFRTRNGWACSSCPNEKQCKALELNKSENSQILSPFNQFSIRRLFNSLPEGKGKARQFLKKVSELLRSLDKADQQIFELKEFFRLDFAAEAEDRTISDLTEIYFPNRKEDQIIEVPGSFLEIFGYKKRSINVLLRSLKTQDLQKEFSESTINPALIDSDTSRISIKSWLNSENVNKQSLQQLRRGISRWLRIIHPVDGFHAKCVAKPNNVLKWNMVYLSVHPAIVFQDIDEAIGIQIPKDIGLTAFLLSDFANAVGTAATKIINCLATDERAIQLAWKAEEYQNYYEQNLEVQLNMPVPEFALVLYVFSLILKGYEESPIPFMRDLYKAYKFEDKENYYWLGRQRKKIIRLADNLFDDYFKLRENLYDGNKISLFIKHKSVSDCLEMISKMDIEVIDTNYWLDDHPLIEQIKLIQQLILKLRTYESQLGKMSLAAHSVLEMMTKQPNFEIYLDNLPNQAWEEIRTIRPDIYSSLKVTLTKD